MPRPLWDRKTPMKTKPEAAKPMAPTKAKAPIATRATKPAAPAKAKKADAGALSAFAPKKGTR